MRVRGFFVVLFRGRRRVYGEAIAGWQRMRTPGPFAKRMKSCRANDGKQQRKVAVKKSGAGKAVVEQEKEFSGVVER